ncbi:MAG: lysylphosphatidylglycerol synthase transmembrane domain-containing protein [Chloroflexi bacterium]|nr:lysylphosphatidylglycerol synthase transmembrane domain-containing protein [Chloroflexota bacterium]
MKRIITSRVWQMGALAGVVTAAAIFFALFIDFDLVWHELRGADWRWLLAAVFALLLSLICYVVRWRILLGNKPSFGFTFHASNIGHGVNTIVPLRAGEVARIALMGSEAEAKVSYTEAVSSYVVERMFEQVMRLVAFGTAVALGAGGVATESALLAVITPLSLAFLALLWLYLHQERVRTRWPKKLAKLPYITESFAQRSINGFLHNLNAASSPRQLTQIFLWSGLTWFWAAVYHVLVLAAVPHLFPSESWLPIALAALALCPPSATTQPIIFQTMLAPISLAGYSGSAIFAYAILLNASQLVVMNLLGLWGLTRIGFSLQALRGLLGQREEVRELVREQKRAE